MAGRYENADAQRSIRKMSGEFNISEAQKNNMVDIATAHLAAGNIADFTTAMAAISRSETKNDISDKLDAMQANSQKQIDLLKAELSAISKEKSGDTVTLTKEQYDDLLHKAHSQ